MTAFVDPLGQIDVMVHTPDRRIQAWLRGRTEVAIAFARGVYGRVEEGYLIRQLPVLGKLLWAGRTRQVGSAARAAFLDASVDGGAPRGPAEAAFRDARDHPHVEGRSSDGRIVVSTYGLTAWEVRIATGTTRQLDEDQFTAELATAAADLITSMQEEIRVLKLHHLAR